MVVDDLLDAFAGFLPGLKMRIERPTTTAMMTTADTTRRMARRRLRAFCSAASRACLPAFWR